MFLKKCSSIAHHIRRLNKQRAETRGENVKNIFQLYVQKEERVSSFILYKRAVESRERKNLAKMIPNILRVLHALVFFLRLFYDITAAQQQQSSGDNK